MSERSEFGPEGELQEHLDLFSGETRDHDAIKNEMDRLIDIIKERDSKAGPLLIDIGSKEYKCLLYGRPILKSSDVNYFLITSSGFYLCKFGSEDKLWYEPREAISDLDRIDISLPRKESYHASSELEVFYKFIRLSLRGRKATGIHCAPQDSSAGIVPRIETGRGPFKFFVGFSIAYTGNKEDKYTIIDLNNFNSRYEIRDVLESIKKFIEAKDKKIITSIVEDLPEFFTEKPKNDDL